MWETGNFPAFPGYSKIKRSADQSHINNGKIRACSRLVDATLSVIVLLYIEMANGDTYNVFICRVILFIDSGLINSFFGFCSKTPLCV